MAKISNEFKTGIMVIACLAILLLLVIKSGDFELNKEGYEIKAVFNHIGGLRENAPIRLCGMDIGQVKDIQIYYDGGETRITITLWLDSDAKIRKDSKIYITTLGLMGEKYIEITGGSKGMEFVKPGETVEGKDPMQMERLVAKGEEVAENINMTLGDLRQTLKHANDVVTKEEINKIIDNLEETSENFKEFSATLKRQPWRLIWKTKEKKPKIEKEKEEIDINQEKEESNVNKEIKKRKKESIFF